MRAMRKPLTLLLLAVLFLPIAIASAQSPQEDKAALYAKFIENIKGEADAQKLAYEQGQEYLRKYGSDNDQYTAYIQRWLGRYEKADREFKFNNAFNAKDFPKTFELGREILIKDGDAFPVIVRLVTAGSLNAETGNTTLTDEAIGYAKKGLELITSGKVTDPKPFKVIDDARGFFNFSIGWLSRDKAPAEAVAALRRAAENGGTYKTDQATYVALAIAIGNAEYEPLAKEYREKHANKDVTPESEAMLAKIKGIAERIIDAYARAVAVSTKPEQQEQKRKVLEELTALYKQFHDNSDVGLNDLIAGVLTKPLP
jgi:hypothetical protein